MGVEARFDAWAGGAGAGRAVRATSARPRLNKATKGKLMKGNKLSFSFMSFSESGLFNGL
jgi:hypothetical protein